MLVIHPVVEPVFAFLFGATVGSFLNVVIARLPEDRSIIRPRSQCPRCQAVIRWYDNIPVLSFFLLGRRCRSCKEPISWRYPLVELLTAGLAVALWWRFGMSKELGLYFAFSASMVAVTFIDIDHRIIPNEITYGGIVIGLGCMFLWPGFWKSALLGLGAAVGLLVVLEGYSLLRFRETGRGMGMGDFKLMGMFGVWLGWQGLVIVLMLASVQGVLAVIVMKIAGLELQPPLPEEWEEEEADDEKEQEAKEEDDEEDAQEAGPTTFLGAAIPFGPFLALGAVEWLFLAPYIIAWMSGG